MLMFLDRARIFVKAGDGGDGAVSFRREKYVAQGGPDGGDGGKGGDIIFQVDEGLHTLLDFRYKRHYKAEPGVKGQASNMHGRGGKPLIIKVPPGVIVKVEETGRIIGDLTENEEQLLVAKGGKGGRGNARFVTATRQAPTLAERGQPGEEFWLILELKLLADAGLIGFPNAGKSTILSSVSAAKPKIANYPFTTLTPYLGVVSVHGDSFVLADIPGLIEGAHQGVGLGHEFLRHVERSRLLIHVLDTAGTEGRDPLEDFYQVNRELGLYEESLLERPQLVALNKIDLPEGQANLPRVREKLEAEGYEVFPISAATGEGLDKLMSRTLLLLKQLPKVDLFVPVDQLEVEEQPDQPFHISVQNGIFIVEGKSLEKVAGLTNFNNDEAFRRFQLTVKKIGLEEALKSAGIKDGDVVRIGELEFEYLE
jgi:GTP-binding protein